MSGILFDRARSSPDPRWGTIGELVREAAQRSGDREFLRFPGVSLTFAEVHEASSRLAQVLVAHGIGPGDRVAIMLGNVPEWPLSWFAIGKAGAIAVPVNARYRESDLTFVLADSGAVLVLTSDEHAGLVRAVAATVGPVREVLTAAELARELADAPLGDPAVAVEPSAIANFQYTSGTTGFPKACMLSHGYWLRTGWLTAIEAELRADDVMLMAQAFSYMDPQWAALMCLMGGCPLVVLPRFSASRFWRSIREHGATLTYVLGAMPAVRGTLGGALAGDLRLDRERPGPGRAARRGPDRGDRRDGPPASRQAGPPDTGTAVSLLDHARARLARFKVPAYLEFVESLPMTPSERVEKRKLTEPGRDQRTGVFDAAANTRV